MKSNTRSALVAMLLFLSSCSMEPDQDIIVTELAPGLWDSTHPEYIYYENSDTQLQKKLSVLIRFRNGFSYDRLEFELETQTPDSSVWRDTLSVFYQKEDITEVTSLTYSDTKTEYRLRSVLKSPGIYRFGFSPVTSSPINDEVIGIGLEITAN